jgi:hypothetical protein
MNRLQSFYPSPPNNINSSTIRLKPVPDRTGIVDSRGAIPTRRLQQQIIIAESEFLARVFDGHGHWLAF